MRIIAGRLGGRIFGSPKGHRTHPMADRVRGGLFNALGNIEGLTVLDPFAGSGALSFEAVSRGAKSVVAIEIDKRAQDAIKTNIQALNVPGSVKLIHANAGSWSDTNPVAQFDIVLAAPPYDDLQLNLVQKLTRHSKSGGLFVLDWPGKTEIPRLDGLEVITQKSYGDAQLVFYRKFQ